MPDTPPMEQIPFGTNDFPENPEPRAPCVLLLDTSGSMQGAPINELNEGLTTYRDELAADSLSSKRVEVAIVTFGGTVNIICPFTTAEGFIAPTLTAGGETPMGAAIIRGIEMLRQRKQEYREHGIAYFRPWIFLITDGGPTDAWKEAAQRVKEGDTKKEFKFFSVGVEGANMETLAQVSSGTPLKLKGLRFRDLFLWLSSSQASQSRSTPGTDVTLTNPVAPNGWATI